MPEPLDQCPVPPDTLDRIVTLLCNVQARGSIVAACVDKLAVAAADVDAAIDAATAKLIRAADFHRDEERGRALTRLNECYQRAIALHDVARAIQAQRELNRMQGLYPDEAPPPEPPGEGERISRADRRRVENVHLADLQGAVDHHLEPLRLSDSTDDTDADLIRLAAEEIQRLRGKGRRPRPKKGKTAEGQKGRKAAAKKTTTRKKGARRATEGD